MKNEGEKTSATESFFKRTSVGFFLATMVGFFSVVIPPFIFSSPKHYDAPVFSIVRTAIENMMFVPTVLALLAFGSLLGYFYARKWFLLGVGSMVIFPVAAFVEIVVSPSSHN